MSVPCIDDEKLGDEMVSFVFIPPFSSAFPSFFKLIIKWLPAVLNNVVNCVSPTIIEAELDVLGRSTATIPIKPELK